MLISKGTVVQVEYIPLFCLSPIFTVPKPSPDLRVILNLKEINFFISDQKFQMETLSAILPQFSSWDWVVSLDLKDTYFPIGFFPILGWDLPVRHALVRT